MTPQPVEPRPTPISAWTPPLVVAALVLGIGGGWVLRGSDPPPSPTLPARKATVAKEAKAPSKAIDTPIESRAVPSRTPTESKRPAVSTNDRQTEPIPAPIVGDLPALPSALPGTPLAPVTPIVRPADLKADEAAVRRIVAGRGGEVVSAESSEDVGRTLVAEIDPEGRDGLKATLRKALGPRAVLTDAGTVPGSTPELKRMEDDLIAARKRRDQARTDFLPEAPILKQIEEDTLNLERRVSERRRAAARVRVNVLLRSAL